MARSRANANDGFVVELIGEEEVMKLLRDVPEKQGKKALRRGLKAGAKLVTRRAKQRIRADYKTHEKNKLARAVKTRAARRSRKHIAVVTTLGERFFAGDTYYGAFAEFGHRIGKRGKKDTRGGKRDVDTRGWVEGVHPMENAAKDIGRRAAATARRVTLRELNKLLIQKRLF